MKTNNNVIGVGCDCLFDILSVSDDDVDSIESSVGMGCCGWDEVNPKEIIAAAWNRLRMPIAQPRLVRLASLTETITAEADVMTRTGQDSTNTKNGL